MRRQRRTCVSFSEEAFVDCSGDLEATESCNNFVS